MADWKPDPPQEGAKAAGHEPKAAKPATAADRRKDRLAAALRDNLRRRKDAARAKRDG